VGVIRASESPLPAVGTAATYCGLRLTPALNLSNWNALSIRKLGAFTLIEMLVVIAIISLLAAILSSLPSNAKIRAHAISCMKNDRQPTLARKLNAADNNGVCGLSFADGHSEIHKRTGVFIKQPDNFNRQTVLQSNVARAGFVAGHALAG